MTEGSPSMVEQRLEESVATLRRLPPVKVSGYFSSWPSIVHDDEDKRMWEATARRLGPPTAKAISQMQETLTWLRWVKEEEYRLLWLRAHGVSWKIIAWRLECDRTTAWKNWVFALTMIANALNRGKPYQLLMEKRALLRTP